MPCRGHPAGGLVRPADEQLGQLGIRPPIGHPQEIGHEALVRVGLDARVEARHLALGVGDEGAQIIRPVEGDAQEAAAVVGVAAA